MALGEKATLFITRCVQTPQTNSASRGSLRCAEEHRRSTSRFSEALTRLTLNNSDYGYGER